MNYVDHYLEKNRKLVGLIKDELGGKIMTDFSALKAKTYS